MVNSMVISLSGASVCHACHTGPKAIHDPTHPSCRNRRCASVRLSTCARRGVTGLVSVGWLNPWETGAVLY